MSDDDARLPDEVIPAIEQIAQQPWPTKLPGKPADTHQPPVSGAVHSLVIEGVQMSASQMWAQPLNPIDFTPLDARLHKAVTFALRIRDQFDCMYHVDRQLTRQLLDTLGAACSDAARLRHEVASMVTQRDERIAQLEAEVQDLRARSAS